MRAGLFASVCALLWLTSACAPADLEGDWSGTWRIPLSGESGSISMSMTQDDDAVSGTFELGGTLCVGSGDVSGSVTNRQVDLELSNGIGGRIVVDARLNAASDAFDGDFDVTGGVCSGARGKIELSLD